MLRHLRVRNFRCFTESAFDFTGRNIVVSGANGRGKTSMLEAIFFIANLRSFRTQRISELQKLGTDSFALDASIEKGRHKSRYEIISFEAARTLIIDNVRVSKASNFAGSFAAVAFLPSDPEIITGRSSARRRFLDMYISMLDREYFAALQTYGSALKNRNALLRNASRDKALLSAYHPILAESGSAIASRRNFHLRILNDFMHGILEEIRPELAGVMIKSRSLKESLSANTFLEKLEANIDRDIEKHYTAFGPQTDDFDFTVNGKNLRTYGSRGQCAAIALALKMAQFDITLGTSSLKESTIALVDDVTGDLDLKTRNAFFKRISNAKQTFHTFTETDKYIDSIDFEHIDLDLAK